MTNMGMRPSRKLLSAHRSPPEQVARHNPEIKFQFIYAAINVSGKWRKKKALKVANTSAARPLAGPGFFSGQGKVL